MGTSGETPRMRGRWARPALMLLVLLATARSFAAVTVESTSSGAVAASTTLTFSTTTVGNYPYLLVEVTMNVATNPTSKVSAVTFGASSLAFLNAAVANNRRVEFWGLANPTLGTNTVTITASLAAEMAASAITVNGVSQTTPVNATAFANNAGSTAASVTVADVASGLALDALAIQGNRTVTAIGAAQTQVWTAQSGAAAANVLGNGTYAWGAASVTMTQTISNNTAWEYGAISFNPAATVADLSVVGTFTPDPVAVGATTTATFTVTNNGPASATGVTFATTGLPSNLSGLSASSSVGTCTITTSISCSLGTIANAASVTVTISGAAVAAGTISATGTASTAAQYDPYANSTSTAIAAAQTGVCGTPGRDGAAGNITTTVNTYFSPAAAVVLPPGSTSTQVALSAGTGAANGIAVGDLLMIMQMQDAGINSSNDQRYGAGLGTPTSTTGAGAGYTNLNSAGRYEYIVATSVAPNAGGSALTFTGAGASGGLLYTYTEAAASATKGASNFQIIRVPQYTTASLGNGATSFAVAPAWNGTVGGVFAIDVEGLLTLNGTVNVDALGFRGGGGRVLAGGTGVGTDYLTLSSDNTNGSKGEGIAGTPKYVISSAGALVTNAVEGYPNGSYARGAPANAGGGGTDSDPPANDENDGGGGGANGGAGGMGGNSWNVDLAQGGFGGVAFPAAVSRVAMGGGGGAGTTNNGSSDPTTNATGINSSGATGGGVVIVRAGQVTGTGTISAKGGTSLNTMQDSTGGGGAGGTVVVIAESGSLSGLTVSAIGGNGGTAWATQAPGTCPGGSGCNYHGPGGGGGGGVVLLSSPAASVSVAGGASGTTTTAAVAYGATPGTTGTVTVTAAMANMPGAGSGAQCASADLSLTTTASASVIAAGGSVTYTQTVTNNGLDSAEGLYFNSVIPAGMTFTSITIPSGWSCTTPKAGAAGTISCIASAMASGASSQFTVVAAASGSATNGTVLTNNASVGALTNDPNGYNNSTQTSVTVQNLPANDLALTDVATPTSAAVGSTVTFTHVLTYLGSSNATTLTYTEALPANTSLITPPTAAGWTCSSTSPYTCTIASLAPGSTVVFTTAVQVTGGTTITDSATIGSVPADNYTGNNTASASVAVVSSGTDLAVSDQASALTVQGGNSVIFSHTVTNNGPNTSGTVTLTDTLPAGTTYQSYAAPAGWVCVNASNVVTCTGSGLLPSGSVAIEVSTLVPTTAAIGTVETDSVTVANSTGDPNSANNTATASSTVAGSADLGVTGVATPNPIAAATTGTFTATWTVTNNGPTAAGPSTLLLTVPANTTAPAVTPPGAGGVTWTCNPPSGGAILCTAPSVPVGYNQNFTFTSTYTNLTAGAGPTVVTSTANIAPNTVPDPIPGNNIATVTVPVVSAAEAEIAITQTTGQTEGPIPATAGQSVTVYWTITNLGPSSVANPELFFTVPAGTTLSSYSVPVTCTLAGSTLSCPSAAAFPVGSAFSQNVSFTLMVNSSDTATIVPSLTVTSEPTATNGPNGSPATASANITIPVIESADLSLTNSCTPVDQQAGSNITCTQKVTNNGPSDAQGVVISEPVPANTTFVAGSSSPGCSLSGSTVNCTVGTVTFGSSATITFVAAITAGTARGTSITDKATVSATTTDPVSTNNSASSTVTVASATDADVAVTDVPSVTSVASGSNITYTQTITNNGPAASGGLTLTETTPPNTTFVSDTVGAWTCTGTPGVGAAGTFTCTLAAGLASGASSPFTLVVKTATGLTAGTNITDTATAVGTAADPNSNNNTATANTTIQNANSADVSVAIVAANITPRTGTSDTLTVTATNNGPSTSTNTTVTIPIPNLEQYVSATPSSGSCTLNGSSVVCNLGSINSGSNATVALVVNAVNWGQTTNTASVVADQVDSNLANNSASTTLTILAPTEIKLSLFHAAWSGGEVVLEWRTNEEARNLGFNVYREVNGQRMKLNPSLIAGSAVRMRSYLPQHTAAAYTWIDNAPVTGARYWLEDVTLSGARTSHGPATAPGSTSGTTATTAKARIRGSALLADLNAAAQTAADAPPPLVPNATATIQPVVAADTGIMPVGPAASTGRPGRGERNASTMTSAQLAGQAAIEISINQEGWYRITQAQLAAAGLGSGVDVNTLRLINEGNEVPMRVTTAGGSLASIEFYGIGLDNPYTDTRVYWLIWGGDAGQRLQSAAAAGANLPSESGYEAEAVREDKTFYFAALTTNGDADNFFGDVISGTPVDEHLPMSGVDAIDASTAQLDIALQGMTDPAAHDVQVTFNSVSMGEIKFADMNQGSLVTAVPTSLLNEGDNVVTLTPLGGDNDVTAVAHVIVMYQRRLQAIDDRLRFTVTGQTTAKVTAFSSAAIHVVNINNGAMSDAAVTVTQEADGTYSATFSNTSNAPGVYFAYTDATVAQPLAMANHTPTSLSAASNATDLLIVSHSEFIPALAPLVADREQQGLKVKVVDIDDVYGEFNFGERTPYALQSFLQLAATTWSTAPRWLLLVGDASVDPRNYLGFGSFDFVPTKIVPTEELKTASDGWFTDFHSTGLEQIATGRLPVRTAADTTAVVNKILAYESQPAGTWSSSAYFVADENIGADFQTESATVGAELPAGVNLTTLNLSAYATDHTNVINQLNAGNLIVNYLGHGSENDWADPSFFSDADAEALTNGAMTPFFINMACLNGLFHDVYETSLATSLLFAPNGGAVAVWASSGLTDPEPQLGMDEAIMPYLFATPSQTIGEATRNAKQGVTDPDVRRTWILFGDPSLKLKSATGGQ